MKFLTDANEYLKLSDWAEKVIEKHGVDGANKIWGIVDRAIKHPESQGAIKMDIEKLEGISASLTLAINEHRLKTFMAPGIEAVKRVKKYGQEQSGRRNKRTFDHLKERNQKIIEHFKEHFKKTGMSKRSFAELHTAEFGLKTSQIRSILSK
jgi:hypothetical protein